MPELGIRVPQQVSSSSLFFLTLRTMMTMSKSTSLLYFILMKDGTAEKKIKSGLTRRIETLQALKGSLWCLEAKDFADMGRRSSATLRSVESPEVTITSQLQEITKLNAVEFKLLLALTTCKERDVLYTDARRLLDVCRIYESWQKADNQDSNNYPRVRVVDDDRLSVDHVTGTLIYVGGVPERSGFWFGVVMDPLFQNVETSNTTGVFENRVLFSCPLNSGLLVTANKIFPLDHIAGGRHRSNSPLARSALHQSYMSNSLSDQSVQIDRSQPSFSRTPPASRKPSVLVPKPDVKIDDRVVWYDERNNQQLATVRWIGIIDEKPDVYTIGVENDKPVGSGMGVYKNKQLFETRPNHASLIPAVGLLKAEIAFGTRDLVPPAPFLRDSPPTETNPRRMMNDWDYNGRRDQPFLHSHSDSGSLGRAAAADAGWQNMYPSLSSLGFSERPTNGQSRARYMHGPFECDPRDLSLRQTSFTDSAVVGGAGAFLDLNRTGDFSVCDVTDVIETGHGAKDFEREITPRPGSRDATGLPGIDRRTPARIDGASASASHEPRGWQSRESDKAHTEPLVGASPPIEIGGMPVSRSNEALAAGGFDAPRSIDAALLKTDLDVGSMVEVEVAGFDRIQYGVIRWMGILRDKDKPYVGVELEEENPACTDGSFEDRRLFRCAPKKGFFVRLNKLRRDKRFAESSHLVRRTDSEVFGSIECVNVEGVYPQLCFNDVSILKDRFRTYWAVTGGRYTPHGKNMGIQGHHNSCYLDATLFSMFAFSSAFDSILHRPKSADRKDIAQYSDVQTALRDGIVNPLRTKMYARADKVLHLRRLLDQCSSVQGLLDEEKDPDEFLHSLLQETMRAEPFIKFSSGQSGYCYQLFVEKDDKMHLPTTQQLFSLSLFLSDIKLAEVPRCLILQMPRFGKDFQVYKRVVPSLTLDVTNMLEHDPQACCFCGKIAAFECRNCFQEFGKGVDRAYFCDQCITASHSTTKRSNHEPKKLEIYRESLEYYDRSPDREIRSEIMELFAVVCIKTSHYVAFTKCGPDPAAPWVFFDSMADRIGQRYGHNIPQLEICPDLPDFLKEDRRVDILRCTDDKDLPEQMRRLLCDGYICMYQSPDLEPYR